MSDAEGERGVVNEWRQVRLLGRRGRERGIEAKQTGCGEEGRVPHVRDIGRVPPSNILVELGCSVKHGPAGGASGLDCLDATLPRAAGREAAVHVRSKMSDKERVIAAMIIRLSSPGWSTLGRGKEGRRE
jgi:hypothetical protein